MSEFVSTGETVFQIEREKAGALSVFAKINGLDKSLIFIEPSSLSSRNLFKKLEVAEGLIVRIESESEVTSAMIEDCGAQLVSGYISDGLVFWLDGIERGGIDGVWRDLIGGTEYVLSNFSHFTDKSLIGEVVTLETKPSGFNSGECTISFCGRILDRGQVVFFRSANIRGVNCAFYYITDDGRQTGPYLTMEHCGYNPRNAVYRVITNPQSVKEIPLIGACNVERAIVNNYSIIRESSSSGCTTNNKNINSVGQIGSEIFAVRIYNRLLSEEEMRHNQVVDEARFGLKFPDPTMTLELDEDPLNERPIGMGQEID